MKLTWTWTAIADRHKIYDHIEADNPRAAVNLDNIFEEKASQLLKYMNMGRLGRVSGTRELVISGTQYLMIYRYDKSSVIILRILHGAQQWPDASGN